MKNSERSFIFRFCLVVSVLLFGCSTFQPQAAMPASKTALPNSGPVEASAPAASLPALNPSAAAEATGEPTLPAEQAQAALVAAFTKLASAYPYRLTEATSGGVSLDRITDYAAADRVHSSWVMSPNPEKRETITIGSQTWWKINGAWDANPSDTYAAVDLYALLAPNLHNVQSAGQESANGAPCNVFRYDLTINETDFSLTGSGKAWVGIADGLPRQLDLEATTNGAAVTTQLVYSYGVQFDIQPPN